MEKLESQGQEELKKDSEQNPQLIKDQFDYINRLYGINGIERVKSIKEAFKSILDSVMFSVSIYLMKFHGEGFHLSPDQYGNLLNIPKDNRASLIKAMQINLTSTEEFYLN